MKKEAWMRGLLGFPLGISLGYVITILISLFDPNGAYTPCVPELMEQTGSEITAVILQAVLSGILGSAFAAASVIWEMEKLSLAKQTGLYFCIISAAMLPIAYATHWMEHTLVGVLSYFGVFVIIFVVIFLIQYFFWKRRIARLNSRLPH